LSIPFRSQCNFTTMSVFQFSILAITALARNASRSRASPQYFQVAPRTSPTNKRQRTNGRRFSAPPAPDPELAAEHSTSTANERNQNHRKTFSNAQKDGTAKGRPRLSDPRDKSDSECGEEGRNHSRVERPNEGRKERKMIKSRAIAPLATGDHR
jgi:hypothetical protein